MNKTIKKLSELLNTGVVENIFVDCGQGDKLEVIDVDFDKNLNSVQLIVNKNSLGWIKMDVTHPIKLVINKK